MKKIIISATLLLALLTNTACGKSNLPFGEKASEALNQEAKSSIESLDEEGESVSKTLEPLATLVPSETVEVPDAAYAPKITSAPNAITPSTTARQFLPPLSSITLQNNGEMIPWVCPDGIEPYVGYYFGEKLVTDFPGIKDYINIYLKINSDGTFYYIEFQENREAILDSLDNPKFYLSADNQMHIAPGVPHHFEYYSGVISTAYNELEAVVVNRIPVRPYFTEDGSFSVQKELKTDRWQEINSAPRSSPCIAFSDGKLFATQKDVEMTRVDDIPVLNNDWYTDAPVGTFFSENDFLQFIQFFSIVYFDLPLLRLSMMRVDVSELTNGYTSNNQQITPIYAFAVGEVWGEARMTPATSLEEMEVLYAYDGTSIYESRDFTNGGTIKWEKLTPLDELKIY